MSTDGPEGKQDTIDLLKDLVAIDSQNPSLVPEAAGESEMRDPLTPVVDGGRLYGRGAYDMKAGLAAALIACREAARTGLEMIVAAVADEEHSSLGVQEILRHVRADAAIVTEPTELAVATAHRGFVWTEFSVTGVAAHGSRPHLGGPVRSGRGRRPCRRGVGQHPGHGGVRADAYRGGHGLLPGITAGAGITRPRIPAGPG